MDESLSGLSSQQKRELLATLLRQRAEQQESSGEFPLTEGQKGLWYAFVRDRSLTAYNVFLPCRFRSQLNVDALKRCVVETVRRHVSLRTLFTTNAADREPRQHIAESLPPDFIVHDAAGWDDDRLREGVLRETQRPFDLTTGPLLRLAVFRVADDDWVVVATTHHIVVDFWSLVVILDEIRQLYPAYDSGKPIELDEAPANFHEFVQAQSKWVRGTDGEAALKRWMSRLEPIQKTLQWQTDYARPPRFSHRAGVMPFRWTGEAAARIKAFARRRNVTSNVVVMSLLQGFLSRWSGQETFLIGTPFSGRRDQRYEQTVGFFVNMLPVVADLRGGPSLEAMCDRVSAEMLASLADESMPLSEIVRNVKPPRDASRHPLFQVACTFEKSHLAQEAGRAGFLLDSGNVFEDFGGLRQESFFIPHPTCQYDLEFVFEVSSSRVDGLVCYCSDLFAEDTIVSLVDQFASVKDQLLDTPRKPLGDTMWRVATEPFDHERHHPRTLVDLLRPSESGLVIRARRFAAVLRSLGIGVGDIVPVCYPKGEDAWVGILGVIFAGAAVVPLDADQPAVSWGVLSEDTSIRLVVAPSENDWADPGVQRISVDSPADQENEHAEEHVEEPSPEELAYVVYTSGTTGKPKGVMIQHRAVANTLQWRARAVPLSADDRVLLTLSHQFDAAFAVMLTSLHQGAKVVFADQWRLDIDGLVEQLIRDRVTILPAVPSVQRALVEHPKLDQCRLREVWSGGESMPAELVTAIQGRSDCTIRNFYGPTEAAIEATMHCIDGAPDGRPISIGKAIDGNRVLLLDEQLRPVPVAVAGQLAIAGVGLAKGYLNRSKETESAFVELELDDAEPVRVYLTGDQARRHGDGTLEFLGRSDLQVSVRGQRIELEEIERVVTEYSSVYRAAVAVAFEKTERESLVAFVEGDETLDVDGLRGYLSGALPRYKRPTHIRILDKLPIGSTGKVDRHALGTLRPADDSGAAAVRTPPRSALDQFLLDHFCRSLGIGSLGIDDNFFESGGTSLQAAVLASRLSDELAVHVSSSLLFDDGDVASVADSLTRHHRTKMEERFGELSETAAAASSVIVPMKATGTRPPVILIHPPGGIVACYRELADALDSDQPLLAIRSREVDETGLPATLEALASDYVKAIQNEVAAPCVLGGWSLGGVIAMEVARQLIEAGGRVSGLILIDSTVPSRNDDSVTQAGQEYGIELTLEQLSRLSDDEQLPLLYEHAEKLGVLGEDARSAAAQRIVEDLRQQFAHHLKLCERYQLTPLELPSLLIRPESAPVATDSRPDRGWGRWLGDVTVRWVSGHHHSMVRQPGATAMADQIARFASLVG